MKTIVYVTLFVFLLVSAGCANMSERTKCIMTATVSGAVIGAGGGAASDADGGNGEAAAIGFVAGGVLGGVAGLMICKTVAAASPVRSRIKVTKRSTHRKIFIGLLPTMNKSKKRATMPDLHKPLKTRVL